MRPDLVALDQTTRTVLVVEVKERIEPKDISFFLDRLRAYARNVGSKRAYFALVDSDYISIYEDIGESPSLINKLSTREIFADYASLSDVDTREGKLAGLTQAWLRDLSHHWKHERPPSEASMSPELLELLGKADVSLA